MGKAMLTVVLAIHQMELDEKTDRCKGARHQPWRIPRHYVSWPMPPADRSNEERSGRDGAVGCAGNLHMRRAFDIVALGDVRLNMARDGLPPSDLPGSATVTGRERMLANRIIGEMRSGDIVKHFPELQLVDKITFDLAQIHTRTVKRGLSCSRHFPWRVSLPAAHVNCDRNEFATHRAYRCRNPRLLGRVHISRATGRLSCSTQCAPVRLWPPHPRRSNV